MKETHTDQPSSPEAKVPRRDFFRLTILGISAFIASLVGIPLIGYLLSPALKRTTAEWIQLGPLSDFSIGTPSQVVFTRFRKDGWIERRENISVWVWRKTEPEVLVYNGHCTHLGCAYSWFSEGKHASHFFCPCHDGIYALDGTVIGGPPPRPLDTMKTKVENGILYVVYQDFRVGVPDKVPA